MGDMEAHFPWLAPFTLELRRLSFNLDHDHYFRLIHKFEGLISVEATKLRRKPNRASKLVVELRRLIGHLRLVGVSMGLDGRREGASLRGLALILTHHIALINASSMKERRSAEVVGGEAYVFVKSMLDGVGGDSLVLDTILLSTADNHQAGSIGHALLHKVLQDGSSYWQESGALLKFLVVLRLLQDMDSKLNASKVIAAIPRTPWDFEAFVERRTGIKGRGREVEDFLPIIKPIQLIQMSREELCLPATSGGVDSDDPSDGEEELKILLDTQGDQSWDGSKLEEVKAEPHYWRSLGSVEEESSGEEAEMGTPAKYSTRSPSPRSPASTNEHDMYEDVLGDDEEEGEADLTISRSVLAAIDQLRTPTPHPEMKTGVWEEFVEEEEEESETEVGSDSSIEEVFADMAVKTEGGREESENERDEASADSDSDHYYYPKIKGSKESEPESSSSEEEPSPPKKLRPSPHKPISQQDKIDSPEMKEGGAEMTTIEEGGVTVTAKTLPEVVKEVAAPITTSTPPIVDRAPPASGNAEEPEDKEPTEVAEEVAKPTSPLAPPAPRGGRRGRGRKSGVVVAEEGRTTRSRTKAEPGPAEAAKRGRGRGRGLPAEPITTRTLRSRR